jgi:hypothetical protein
MYFIGFCFLLSQSKVGQLMGPGGQNVKMLEDTSGASIIIPSKPNHQGMVSVRVRGLDSQVAHAVQLVGLIAKQNTGSGVPRGGAPLRITGAAQRTLDIPASKVCSVCTTMHASEMVACVLAHSCRAAMVCC